MANAKSKRMMVVTAQFWIKNSATKIAGMEKITNKWNFP